MRVLERELSARSQRLDNRRMSVSWSSTQWNAAFEKMRS